MQSTLVHVFVLCRKFGDPPELADTHGDTETRTHGQTRTDTDRHGHTDGVDGVEEADEGEERDGKQAGDLVRSPRLHPGHVQRKDADETPGPS